jgi:hypothetical protein
VLKEKNESLIFDVGFAAALFKRAFVTPRSAILAGAQKAS